jgi:hypothetical protein
MKLLQNFMTKTKADILYESLANFTDEEGAIECAATMRDYARELESENARLTRELQLRTLERDGARAERNHYMSEADYSLRRLVGLLSL